MLALSLGLALGAGADARAAQGEDMRFTNRSANINEAGGHVQIQISRGATRALEASTAGYRTVDGSAESGGDYISHSGLVELDVGETAASIAIFLRDDVE